MVIEGKVLIAQGGGPTAVINQTLVGIVREARRFPQVRKVYGALYGVHGIKNEEFIDLTQETRHNLERVALTPSSALLSTRDRPDSEYCKQMFRILKAHDIRYFFYIGGNDSADTTRIVNDFARDEGYDFVAIHVPKTIDNDLTENDHTPGFGSAAKFVAEAFAGINLDNRSLPGVYIGVVMGRHAGFLTASAGIARRYPDDGPHLIYLPERPFSIDKFLEDVAHSYQKYGRCIVAVSEGIHNADGEFLSTILSEHKEVDAHGNVSLSGNNLSDALAGLVRDKLKIKRVRGDTLGYLQRSFLGCHSAVDQTEAREVGERAVQLALWQGQSGSMTLQRTGDYSVDYALVPLEKVAAKTRIMPDEFINAEGNHVTDAFRSYLSPLLGRNDIEPVRLRAVAVPKIYYQSRGE